MNKSLIAASLIARGYKEKDVFSFFFTASWVYKHQEIAEYVKKIKAQEIDACKLYFYPDANILLDFDDFKGRGVTDNILERIDYLIDNLFWMIESSPNLIAVKRYFFVRVMNNTRKTKRLFGKADYVTNKVSIYIQRHIARFGEKYELQVIDTLIHELAHIFTRSGHTSMFYDFYEELQRRVGIKVSSENSRSRFVKEVYSIDI